MSRQSALYEFRCTVGIPGFKGLVPQHHNRLGAEPRGGMFLSNSRTHLSTLQNPVFWAVGES